MRALLHNAGHIGLPSISHSAFDYAVEYVHDRKQFGVPVGTFQLMQGKYLRTFRRYTYLQLR